MVKFLQLSDLHISKNDGKDNNQNCIKIVSYITNRYTNDKPVVLITGDIVDDGDEEQYKKAVEILKPLVETGFKVLAVPGNHDYGPLGNIYTENSQQLFQDYILGKLLNLPEATKPGVRMEDIFPMQTVVEDVLFLGVDSVVGAEDEFMHFASGEVGKDQREKIKEILKANKGSGKKVVVYFHHHPFNRSFVMEMDDAKEVMKILSNNVDALCFGHDHKSDIWFNKDNIDLVIASRKSTKRLSNYKFQYKEITLDGETEDYNVVTFKSV